MDDATAKAFIRQRCYNEVEVAYPLPTQYDNAPDISAQNGKIWARASIRMGDNFKVSIGTPNRFRHPGVLIYNIFTALDQGDDPGDQAVVFIRGIFQNTKVNDVSYRTASTPFGGVSEGWWQTNISIPFYFDELS